MRKILTVLLVIVLIIAAVILVMRLAAEPAPGRAWFQTDLPRPLVMAHQGGDGLWPGNTMYAFERAAAMGADVLEMDVHITQDGQLVLMHDETVDRTTDGTGKIEEMTLAELKALDAGYDWSPDDGQTFPFRGQGITAAALDEVFQAFPDMLMNIEIKLVENQPIAEPFCQAIRDQGMQDKVLVASFHSDLMAAFRAACPEVATSATQDEVINFFVRHFLFMAGAYSPPTDAVQVPEYRGPIHILTERFVADAHSRNMEVHPWTINETADMQRVIDLGVDGIITDYPDRLLQVLGRAGQ
jgi:glycerophosphoryl diester phosphodiesterase